jgi:hypothetical protein
MPHYVNVATPPPTPPHSLINVFSLKSPTPPLTLYFCRFSSVTVCTPFTTSTPIPSIETCLMVNIYIFQMIIVPEKFTNLCLGSIGVYYTHGGGSLKHERVGVPTRFDRGHASGRDPTNRLTSTSVGQVRPRQPASWLQEKKKRKGGVACSS